jgi:hypothetical protein
MEYRPPYSQKQEKPPLSGGPHKRELIIADKKESPGQASGALIGIPLPFPVAEVFRYILCNYYSTKTA